MQIKKNKWKYTNDSFLFLYEKVVEMAELCFYRKKKEKSDRMLEILLIFAASK